MWRTALTGHSAACFVFQPNLSPQTFDNGRALSGSGVGDAATRPASSAYQRGQFGNAQSVFMLGNSPGVVDNREQSILLFDPFELWPSDGSSPHARSSTGPIGQFRLHAGRAIAVRQSRAGQCAEPAELRGGHRKRAICRGFRE